MKIDRRYTIWAVLAVLIFLNIFIWLQVVARDRGILTVAFLDIGQGDAIFIEAPNGNQMLIDGGPGKAVLKELGKEMRFYDRSIEVVLATHPDKDHIGGLSDVLKRFDVDYVIDPGAVGETATYESFVAYTDEEDAQKIVARRGMKVLLDTGVYFEILYPDRSVNGFASNDASIIGKLTYGDVSFILTGDSPQKIEKYLVALDGNALDVDVLKFGHHGSKTSTAEIFLSAVSPTYGIISAGKDNRYGHPHQEVMALAAEHGVKMLSTAEAGTIVFKTDGSNIWIK